MEAAVTLQIATLKNHKTISSKIINFHTCYKTKLDDVIMHFYLFEYLTFKFFLYVFFVNKDFAKVPEDVLLSAETIV